MLRNTYGLLSMTLLLSAATAAAAVAWQLPGPFDPDLLPSDFGLLFGIHKLQTAARGRRPGLRAHRLRWLLARALAQQRCRLAGGSQVVMLALGSTGAIFLALSAWVRATRRDSLDGRLPCLPRHGGGLASRPGGHVLRDPGAGATVSAVVALLSAGMILFETDRIVNGGGVQLRARHGQPLRLDLQPVHQPAQPVRPCSQAGVSEAMTQQLPTDSPRPSPASWP